MKSCILIIPTFLCLLCGAFASAQSAPSNYDRYVQKYKQASQPAELMDFDEYEVNYRLECLAFIDHGQGFIPAMVVRFSPTPCDSKNEKVAMYQYLGKGLRDHYDDVDNETTSTDLVVRIPVKFYDSPFELKLRKDHDIIYYVGTHRSDREEEMEAFSGYCRKR